MSGIAVHMAMFAAAAGGLLALALASDKPDLAALTRLVRTAP